MLTKLTPSIDLLISSHLISSHLTNVAVGMLILCPFFDDIDGLRRYMFTTPTLLRISLSCFFALGVNISNYLVLGKTSPLTYQVLGHLKTVLILVLGFLMFGKEVNMRNLMGIFVAMLGVIAYTEVKRRSPSPSLSPSPSQGGGGGSGTGVGSGSHGGGLPK